MKEQFVTYEIALKLKYLGFDEECLGDYYIIPSDKTPNPNGEFLGLKYEDVSSYTRLVSAPLWQQAIDWIWSNYQLCIYFRPDRPNIGDLEYVIERQFKEGVLASEIHMTLPMARKSAILKAIELCKDKK